MNREIKFRVWDKILQNWSKNTQHFVHARVGSTMHVMPEQGDRFTFEQYTGLSDKTGVEIFEGDLVKGVAVAAGESAIYGGKETAFVGEVKWDLEDAGFFYESTDDQWPHIKPWFVKDVTVIGSIHENTVLLEKP